MTSLAAGASLVWLPVPNFNLLTELLVEDGAAVAGAGLVERSAAVFVAPGVRWAHNFRSGLQVVPGAAYAVGLGDAEADSALLLYLSFEHRFRH